MYQYIGSFVFTFERHCGLIVLKLSQRQNVKHICNLQLHVYPDYPNKKTYSFFRSADTIVWRSESNGATSNSKTQTNNTKTCVSKLLAAARGAKRCPRLLLATILSSEFQLLPVKAMQPLPHAATASSFRRTMFTPPPFEQPFPAN